MAHKHPSPFLCNIPHTQRKSVRPLSHGVEKVNEEIRIFDFVKFKKSLTRYLEICEADMNPHVKLNSGLFFKKKGIITIIAKLFVSVITFIVYIVLNSFLILLLSDMQDI